MASIKQKVYKHSEYFGNIFNHMRSNKKYCDFTLKAKGGENIKVHKVVLEAVSPYFVALFNADMREKKEGVVTFPEIDSGILRQIIGYIYTSEITINDNNAQLLLAASHILQIQWIVDQCSDYLKKTVNTTNCLTIRRLADLHSCEVLSGYCTDYMLKNFENFVANKSFLKMSYEELKDVISSDDLFVQREDIFYGAVINWVKSDIGDRKVHLTELMSHVRLPLIKFKDILKHFIEEPLMKTDSEFKDLLTKCVGDQLYAKNKCEPNIKLTQRRKLSKPSQLILIAGETCQLYDSSWNGISIPPMHNSRKSICTVATNKNFYVIGGYYTNSSVVTGWGERFDPILKKWTPMPDMPTRRYNFGAVALGHSIYASGGFESNHGTTNKVEIYNAEISEWKEGPPKDFAGYTKSVKVNNAIYCVDEHKVCCFDPRTPYWTDFSNSSVYRHDFCLVSDDQTYVYCIGGRKNNFDVATVDRLDVRNRKWESLDNMGIPRCGHSAVLKNNLIYVFGGVKFYFTYMMRSTVEMYDIQNEEWTPLDNIKINCFYAGADILNID